jgi:hypothetical protein
LTAVQKTKALHCGVFFLREAKDVYEKSAIRSPICLTDGRLQKEIQASDEEKNVQGFLLNIMRRGKWECESWVVRPENQI